MFCYFEQVLNSDKALRTTYNSRESKQIHPGNAFPKQVVVYAGTPHAEKDRFVSYFAWNAWQMLRDNDIYYGGPANVETRTRTIFLKNPVRFLQLKGCFNMFELEFI